MEPVNRANSPVGRCCAEGGHDDGSGPTGGLAHSDRESKGATGGYPPQPRTTTGLLSSWLSLYFEHSDAIGTHCMTGRQNAAKMALNPP